NLEYINALPWPARLKLCQRTLGKLWQTQTPAWLFSLFAVTDLWRRRETTMLLLLAAWAATSLAGVSASGYFFPHYFQQLIPVFCLAAALGAKALAKDLPWRPVPAWCRTCILAGLLCLLPLIVNSPFFFRYTPAEAAAKIWPGNFFAEMTQVGKRL